LRIKEHETRLTLQEHDDDDDDDDDDVLCLCVRHVVVKFVWVSQSSFTTSDNKLDAYEARHLIRISRGGLVEFILHADRRNYLVLFQN